MDSFDAFEDKDFEKLNDVILKAIISSEDVEKVLQDFKSKDLINEMAVVNLILSLDELSGLMFSESTDNQKKTLESQEKNQAVEKDLVENQMIQNSSKKISDEPKNHYHVDGKLLSSNEILFEKFYQGRFNEKQWLKRAKIKV